MSYGLVFAGGGVRGSYELGVWKALSEMDIDVGAVTGTSIGSINAALFAQGDFETAEKLWQSITIDDIMKTENLKSVNLFSMQNVVGIVKELYLNQGLDVSPLENLLKSVIREDKIRASKIDFGLCTYSLSDKKEIEIFKADMPENSICEYLMASACLIGFQPRRIDGKTFLDGGVNNNMPVNMLIDKGYQDIIAVDVGGIGVIKAYDDTGVNLIQISCEQSMVGMMEFERESIVKNIKKGYYDCNKVFGRLCGKKFYFNTMNYYHARLSYSEALLNGIESAGEIFGIDPLAAYRVETFIAGVIESYRRVYWQYAGKIPEKQTLLELITKSHVEEPFAVVCIVEFLRKGERDILSNKLMTNLIGNVFSAANAIVYFLEKGNKGGKAVDIK